MPASVMTTREHGLSQKALLGFQTEQGPRGIDCVERRPALEPKQHGGTVMQLLTALSRMMLDF